MKKIRFLAIALCVCVLLAACTKEDTNQSVPGGTPAVQDTALTPEAPTEPLPVAEANYQYGNMQKNLPAGDFMLYEDGVFIHTAYGGSAHVCVYDMDTGKVSPFCKDATCLHNTSECPSSDSFGNLERYEDELYALTGNRQIAKLDDGYFSEILTGEVGAFCHSGGNLYVETADGSLLVYENGQETPRTLFDEYTAYWTVVFGPYLYAQGYAGENIIRIDLEAEVPTPEILVENAGGIIDGEHIYYVNYSDNNYLYRCNMDGSAPELLLDKPVLLASLNFDDDYFYFRLFTGEMVIGSPDEHDVYRLSKSDPTQIEKIATLPETVYQVFTVPGYNKIFVSTTSEKDDGTLPPVIYAMGRDGSNPQLLEFPDF